MGSTIGAGTAGNGRAAALRRWLQALPDAATVAVFSVKEQGESGDEWSVRATYPSPDKSQAEDIDGALRDEANESRKRTHARVSAHNKAGEVIRTKLLRCEPDPASMVDPTDVAELDGTTTSQLSQLQRHLEADKRLAVQERAQLAEAYGGVLDVLFRTVDRLSDRTEKLAEQSDDAREALHMVTELQLEHDRMALDEEANSEPAENPATAMVLKLAANVIAKQLVPKQLPPTAPAPDAPADGAPDAEG